MKWGKSFECQTGKPWLRPGAVVVVQPGHFAKKPYLCIIIPKVLNWVPEGETVELCTSIPWKSSAVIWPYWVGRISRASFSQFIWFHVLWMFMSLIGRCKNHTHYPISMS